MTQQFDIYGKPLAGGQLYIIQAGTVSTPQDAFQDTNLSIKQPYPMTLDAAGRVPQFFLADASVGGNSTVKIRLQDKNGVVQLASDSVLVIGPSGGTSGGSTVDPTQLIQTGNMILRYGVGVLTGYVRMNGLTVGSATSGATERGNADTQNLFQYLWGADPNLVLTPARGATAAADWSANKQIALPDWRGYAVGALDDMGNSPSGRLGSYFLSATTLGATAGSPSMTLAATNLPPYTPAGGVSSSLTDLGKIVQTNGGPNQNLAPGTGGFGWNNVPTNINGDAIAGVSSAFTGTAAPGWNQTPFGIISPRKLCTFYLKL
jgi:hypothetical protein